MCVGKPRVERKDGDFDGEADKERDIEHDPYVEAFQPGVVGSLVHVVEHVEGVGARLRVHRVEVEGEHDQEHENRPQEGVEEKLDRRVLPSRPPPDADQKVHGQEHDFPENVEEEKVKGAENTHHPRLEQKKEGHVSLDLLLDVPRPYHGEEGEQGREQNHGDADPVHADKVLDIERPDPGVVLYELERPVVRDAGQCPVEREKELHRQKDRNEGEQGSDDLYHVVLPPGDEENEERAQEGQKNHQR